MKKGKYTALVGTYLQLAPVVGLIISAVQMFRGFQVIIDRGYCDYEELIQCISDSMYPSEVGFLISVVGMVFLGFSLLYQKYRAPWFYNFLFVFAIFSILGFPIGTVVGIFLLIYLKKCRAEFLGEEIPHPQR